MSNPETTADPWGKPMSEWSIEDVEAAVAAETRTTAAPGWSDWDAEGCGLTCEAGVGLTIAKPVTGERVAWLCWDEVVDLHRWLGTKIKETPQ